MKRKMKVAATPEAELTPLLDDLSKFGRKWQLTPSQRYRLDEATTGLRLLKESIEEMQPQEDK